MVADSKLRVKNLDLDLAPHQSSPSWAEDACYMVADS
jgi:hypothetical protein